MMQATYFVMNFGRGADDASGTNALLDQRRSEILLGRAEGSRPLRLSRMSRSAKRRQAVLNRVAAAFQKAGRRPGPGDRHPEGHGRNLKTARPGQPTATLTWNTCWPRLIWKGEARRKTRRLGLEWMNKAAKSGSGDAIHTWRARDAKPLSPCRCFKPREINRCAHPQNCGLTEPPDDSEW